MQSNYKSKPPHKSITNHYEMRTELAALHRPGDRFGVELVGDKIHCGVFDDPEAAIREVDKHEANARAVFITLNPLKPSLSVTNELRAIGIGGGISDDDILQRRNLLIDVDATRPDSKHTNATQPEVEAATICRDALARHLEVQGFGKPLISAMTGNGGALVYRVELPADDSGLTHQFLEALADKFNGQGATIDRTIGNAARMWKLCGTFARRAEDTPDRPQRRATISSTNETPVTIITQTLIDQLPREFVAITPKQKAAKRSTKRLPRLARRIIAGKERQPGSGEMPLYGQFVNSLAGAGWSQDETVEAARRYSSHLDLSPDDELSSTIEKSWRDSISFQSGHASRGTTKAKNYATLAARNLAAFGQGAKAIRLQAVYLALCTIAQRAGAVKIGASCREVGELVGLEWQAVKSALHDLRSIGLIDLVVANGTGKGGVGRASFLPNVYELNTVKSTHSSSLMEEWVDLTVLPDAFRDRPLPPSISYQMARRSGWQVQRGPHGDTIPGLGLTAWAVYRGLSAEAKPASAIADALTLHVETVRGVLRELRALTLADRAGSGWIRSPGADLDAVAHKRGTYGALDEMRARHVDERRKFGPSASVELFARADVLVDA